MAIQIGDLTLDEVIQHLVAGDVLHVSGGANFSLPLHDSRTLMAFYGQNRREYWTPDKDTNIRDGEIDRLLGSKPNQIIDKRLRIVIPVRPASTGGDDGGTVLAR